jgi:GNAT superfamily N-acetyltransferase
VTAPGSFEKLDSSHKLASFDCGKQELNRFLQRYALSNQQANSSQTYVICRDGAVIGYYSLTVGSVTNAEATERVRKSMPGYPIPVIILARLAVDRSVQGQGVGPALLKDALLRCGRAADSVGVRALLVHAKDDAAKGFYEHFDFDSSPSDPYHLFLLTKDLQRMISQAGC